MRRAASLQVVVGLLLAGSLVPPVGAQTQKLEMGYTDIENKTVDIYWTDRAPVINGKRDDPCWQTAAVCKDFTTVRAGGRKPSQQTEVRVCHDAANLYVFWLLYEAEMDKHLPGYPPDARDVIDEREYVLLQLDPGCTRKHYYSFEANALGAQRDRSLHGKLGFDPPWRVKSGRFDKGWTMEMSVPWAELVHPGEYRATPQIGECYGINFSRVRHAGGEKSQWSRTFGFHFWGHYARGFFHGRRHGPQLPQVTLESKDLLYYGPGTLDLAIKGRLHGVGGACTLRRNGRVVGQPKPPVHATWRVPYRLTESGTWELEAVLSARGKPFYVCRTRAELPPVREPVQAAQQLVGAAEAPLKVLGHPEKPALQRKLAALKQALGESSKRLGKGKALTRNDWRKLVQDTASLRDRGQRAAFDMNLVRLYPPSDTVRAFGVGAVGSDAKIYEDTRYEGSTDSPIELSLAGHEYESFQLVILPFWRDLDGVAVAFTDLVRQGGGPKHTVSSTNIAWFNVQYVTMPDKYWGPRGRKREPDILMPGKPFAVRRDTVATVWVDVYLPKGTPAGEYRGQVSVTAAGQTVKRELRVRCFGFDLPETVSVRQNHWLSMWRWQPFHGTRPYKHGGLIQNFIYNPTYFERHCRLLSRYRAQPFFFDGNVLWRTLHIYVEPDGRFTFDFTELDKYIAIGKKYHANAYWASMSCNLGAVATLLRASYPVIERKTGRRLTMGQVAGKWLKDFKQGDPTSKVYWDSHPVYRDFLKQYVQHLKDLGMLEMSYFEIYDEPYSAESRWLDMIRHQTWLKSYVPELRLHAYGTNPTQLIGGKRAVGVLDSWSPHLFQCEDRKMLEAIYERRRKHGEEFWWYTCTSREDKQGNATPHLRYTAPYIAQRIQPWFAWWLKVDGFLVFALTHIPKPNYAKTLAERFPNRPWLAGASNGCGTMVYPGPPPNYDLIPSMRLANLRDGMEDYEYLAMLRERVKRLDPKKDAALVQQAKRALTIGPDIIESVYKWAPSAAVLNRRRAELARLIQRVPARR